MHQSRTALICTQPGENILSLSDAKKQVRTESEDDDDTINALIAAVTAKLDGADGTLKRALLTQTWKLVLPGFHHHMHYGVLPARYWRSPFRRHEHGNRIVFPLPPTRSVDQVQYVDVNGAAQTLDQSQYRFIDCGTEHSYLLPCYGGSWPSTRDQPDAVSISFTAGYGDSATDIPEPIIMAAKMMLSLWYENREAALVADRAAAIELPHGVEPLLYNYRILRA